MHLALIQTENRKNDCPGDCDHSLLKAIKELAHLHTLPEIMEIVQRNARELLGADGVTFVLREGSLVHYADEDAIGPLWKGMKFPASACISGWVMLNKTPAAIEDIYSDPRIPHDAYRPTFVKSLIMVPVRRKDPTAAIGAYWATRHAPTHQEVGLLQSLAEAASVAILNDELYREARQAVQVRNDFIGIAAHELRTPLTPIRIQLRLAARIVEKTAHPELAALLQGVEAQAVRIGQLLENLLDVSRAIQGHQGIEPQELVLADFIHGIVAQLETHCEMSGSEISVEIDPSIWGFWDRRKLDQVFVNLIGNAIKFGRGQPILIAARQERELIEITVRDFGIGISPEHHSRIFEKFERNVSTQQYGGFGMGLWITRQIIEAHHGTISVSSTPGKGSCFRICLPQGVPIHE